LLPIVPRPFEDELFSSWQGRVACRYDLSGDGLSEWLGVGGCDRRVIDFARRDFSPAGDVIVSWAKACRLPEEQLREMILSTRPRPQGWYVWGEGPRREPIGVRFVWRASTRTPTPAATIIFAGAGRSWRPASAIGTKAFSRKPALTV